jgi:hypothetical protein
MFQFSKRSIIHFVVLLAVVIASGWFLVHEAKKTENSLEKIGFISDQTNQTQMVASGETNVSASGECTQSVSGDGFEICLDSLKQELTIINKEPLGKTRVFVEKLEKHYVRGKVFFENDTRKNSLFFATDARYESGSSDSSKVVSFDDGKMKVIQNEVNDPLSCELAEGYSFSKNVSGECQKTKSPYSRKDKITVPSHWQLKSGNPKTDCSVVTYLGETEIRAWLEWRTNYVEKEWMLHVDKNDVSKLVSSWPWFPYFAFDGVSESVLEKLGTTNEKTPATLIVKGISYYCEGSPRLIL